MSRLSDLVNNIKDGKNVSFEENIINDEIGNLHNALKDLYESLEKESKLKNIAEEKVDIALKIFDQSIEGILVSDEKNNMILVNKAFTSITGYTYDEIYNKNPNILSSGNMSKKFYNEMWDEIKKTGKWEGKVENRKKDNSIYIEHLKISTIRDEKDKIIYYLATFNSGF